MSGRELFTSVYNLPLASSFSLVVFQLIRDHNKRLAYAVSYGSLQYSDWWNDLVETMLMGGEL